MTSGGGVIYSHAEPSLAASVREISHLTEIFIEREMDGRRGQIP